MGKGEPPSCPRCGETLLLVSISCGRNPGRKYRCGACAWRTGDPVDRRPLREPDLSDVSVAAQNVISWLAERLAAMDPEGRLSGLPALLEEAEAKLPAKEYGLLEELVGL